MVVKVYISGISGNKEVKKRQQRVLMILDSKNIKYDVIDITEPGREADKDCMQANSKCNGGTVSDPNPRSPLPPQIFNDDEYCGDYDQFDMANEIDTLEQFLKVEAPPEEPAQNGTAETATNGDVAGGKKGSKENSQERSGNVSKEGTPAPTEKTDTEMKEGTPVRETTPDKQGADLKEGTPVRESPSQKDAADTAPEKEASPLRNSIEKEIEKTEASEVEAVVESKEEQASKTERASSRERSAMKDSEVTEGSKTDNPSESLIQSEQAAASD